MLGLKYNRIFRSSPSSMFRSISFGAWGTKETLAAVRCKRTSQPMCIPEVPLEVCHLKNGMRLVCEYKCSDVTTLGFFLPAGSMHERVEERGASLFMEHLFFRQTRCKSQQQIEQEVEDIGGKLRAIAMRDMFLFWGTVRSCDIQKLIILLGDIINNGVIGCEEIIKARFTILHELREIETDGERMVMDYIKRVAYQDTELGRSVYPESSVIKCLSAETVSCFRNRLFKPSLMTLVSTGGTSLSSIQKLTETYIGGEVESSLPLCETTYQALLPKYRFSAIDMRLRDDDEKIAHVAIAMETSGFTESTDHCALTVAKEIMGSWDMTHGGGFHNAPFVAHYAFNSNLCHIYKAFNISWANTGLWGCYFACDKMMLQNMIIILQNEWQRLCMTITEKEVERAVNQCKTRELGKMNDSVDRFYDIATSLFRRGCYESISQRVAKFNKIRANVIRETALTYIYDRCPAVVAFGPVENLPEYDRIRAQMYRLRY